MMSPNYNFVYITKHLHIIVWVNKKESIFGQTGTIDPIKKYYLSLQFVRILITS